MELARTFPKQIENIHLFPDIRKSKNQSQKKTQTLDTL